jgi:hypothetical protein
MRTGLFQWRSIIGARLVSQQRFLRYLYNINIWSDHLVKNTGHIYASVSVYMVRLYGLYSL